MRTEERNREGFKNKTKKTEKKHTPLIRFRAKVC